MSDLKCHHINDTRGDAETYAHLLEFDSLHGRMIGHKISHAPNILFVDDQQISLSHNAPIAKTDWSGCDIVIEATGQMKDPALLQNYFDQGVKKVVVTAPILDSNILNIVMGVNDHLYAPARDHIVTAASCTTNCLAPVVKVIHENLGILHGSITTIHNLTNTQAVLDQPLKDLRRARACGESLIPTKTGSAKAIAAIFPELKGKLNGHAIRVPLANASLTDCVFEVRKPTNPQQVNALLQAASQHDLAGILGYETRPLVSIDYKSDPHAAIIDSLSTLVINETHVKIYAWYDNEWGYVNQVLALLRKVAGLKPQRISLLNGHKR